MNKFFMLYREGGRSPTVKHSAEGDAKREAECIAGKHGGPVYLLEAVAKVEVKWEAIAVSAPVVIPSTVDVVKLPGEWVEFDVTYRAMVEEIRRHPTLTRYPFNSGGSVEVEETYRGCRVRARTEFGADWLAQRKAQAQPNGPPTPEQAKAHASAHGIGWAGGRWLRCIDSCAPIAICLNESAVVESSTQFHDEFVGKTPQEIGGKWFPLAADGSPLRARDPDNDLPF